MTLTIDIASILQLAPNCRSSYRAGFESSQAVLDRFGISNSPLRIAHFMAQVLYESGGLSIQFENLNYSEQRLPVVWPTRFAPKGPLLPADYAHNPEKLANEVYGARMGNVDAGDGYRYRGRGLLQITGKDSYRQVTESVQAERGECPDFEIEPDAVIDADWCVFVAAAEWNAKACNSSADQNSIIQVTRKINGGKIGLAERTEWLKRTKNVWH